WRAPWFPSCTRSAPATTPRWPMRTSGGDAIRPTWRAWARPPWRCPTTTSPTRPRSPKARPRRVAAGGGAHRPPGPPAPAPPPPARLDDSAALLPASHVLRRGPSGFHFAVFTPGAVVVTDEVGRRISSTPRPDAVGVSPVIHSADDTTWLVAEFTDKSAQVIR